MLCRVVPCCAVLCCFVLWLLQDLSNMLWGLASLSITPDPAWLQQHMQEVLRRQLQKQLEPQHCGNIGWALAKMGHRYVQSRTLTSVAYSE